jgi:LacI family transcriptional regulator
LKGYEDALRENNMEVQQEYIVECYSGTFEEGKKATRKLLSLPNPPDAIFANNDPMAMGAMMAIKEKGLKIPQDIAIVGFSNWFFGELLEPSLTTVDQPGFEMGQEAARLLIRHIEMKDKDVSEPVHETKILKTKLVIRNSSLKSGSK